MSTKPNPFYNLYIHFISMNKQHIGMLIWLMTLAIAAKMLIKKNHFYAHKKEPFYRAAGRYKQ